MPSQLLPPRNRPRLTMVAFASARLVNVFLVAHPGSADLLYIAPAPFSLTELHERLTRPSRPTYEWRICTIDTGEFELGCHPVRPAAPMPVCDHAVHRDACAPFANATPRSAWKLTSPGLPERLAVLAADFTHAEVVHMVRSLRTFGPQDPPFDAVPVGSGVFPIRQTIDSTSIDGRALDEKGYVQLSIPALPGPDRLAVPA